MADTEYVVAIKPSARRRVAGAGEWINTHGSLRRFDSKPLAREWARKLSTPRVTVWVQDAVPTDPSDADGYLVAGVPGTGRSETDEPGQSDVDDF